MVDDAQLPLTYMINHARAKHRIREIVLAYDYTGESPAILKWMQKALA
jgi:hypothetical protein